MFRACFLLLRFLLVLALLPAQRGAAQHIPARRFLKQFGLAEGLPQPFVYALAQDRQGYLWIGTAEGLVRYDGTEFNTFTRKDGLAEDFVTGLRLDAQSGRLHIRHYQGGRSQQLSAGFIATPGSRPAPWGSAAPDSAAVAWQHRLRAQLPAGTLVNCTLLDAEGNRWLGTAGQGLWRLTDEHVTFFASPDRLTTLARHADSLVAGTARGRLVALHLLAEGLELRSRPLPPTVPGAITALVNSQDTLLVGTATRSVWWTSSSTKLPGDSAARWANPPAQRDGLPDSLRVAALAADAATIWVGTIGDGAYQLSATGAPVRHLTTADGLLHNDIHALLLDRAGRVWFGTHGTGLAVRETSGQVRVHRLVPGGLDVAALAEDAAGRIWIGTEGDGVFCLENGRFRQYTTRQGLPSDYCYGFAPLPTGDLLLVHRNALSRYDARTRSFLVLTSPGNLLVRDCQPNAALADAGGTVWVASRTGLLRVFTAQSRRAAAPLTIPAIVVDGELRRAADFSASSLGSLPAKPHRIAFRFRTASLAPAGLWQYQYRLRGYLDEWSNPAALAEAQFPRLDAGRYVFEVRARPGELGSWSRPAAVAFDIATPFWRTGWFAGLSVLLIGAGIFGVVRTREVTLRRQKFQLETTVRERTQQLRRQKAHIEDMNAELVVARDVAEASRRAKAQFLANMSHEIRTPMNAVIGLTHLLRQTPVNPEQNEYLEAVQSSSQNLLVIINDILDSSKIEAGKLTLEQTAFRLPELLRRVVSMFRFATDAKHLYFQLELDPTVPAAVLGDPVRLNQVLVNLVGNAVKFTTAGGVSVRVAAVAAPAPAELVIRFVVQDTGIGIPANKLEAIFEDFSQANTSTTRQFGGTGLGLSIARNLVELHGGQLRVESTEGIGSAFSFEIPYALADPADVAPEPTLAVGRFEPALRVLVAEDNELNQLVARKTLEAWNVHVTVAANGRLAVVAAGHTAFDAVLMDVQMPEMDGYEASRQLRMRFPDASRLPIIGLTASALPEDRALALEAGMNDTLTKPFDPALLYARLAHYTGRIPLAAPDQPAIATTGAASGAATADFSASSLPNWTLLEELAGGNEVFIDQIVNTFLTQGPQLQRQLAAAFTAADTTAVARITHKLKGQVAYFGVDHLYAALETLEHQARPDAPAEVLAPLVRQIHGQLQALYPQLRERLVEQPNGRGA